MWQDNSPEKYFQTFQIYVSLSFSLYRLFFSIWKEMNLDHYFTTHKKLIWKGHQTKCRKQISNISTRKQNDIFMTLCMYDIVIFI